MTDREMLELAAKAAGLRFAWEPALRADDTESLEPIVFSDTGFGEYWNPLTDDGDEARLEAALGINIQWDKASVYAAHFGNMEFVTVERYADHGGDKQAARRLAGVRAAAEIGKSMEAADG